MGGLVGDLTQSRLERRQHALPIDQSEQAGDADPEARIDAHPLTVAGQQIVNQLPDRLAERGTVERLRERAGQRGNDALIPVVSTHHLKRRGERRRQRTVEQQITEARDHVTGRFRRHLGREPASQLARRDVEVARGQPLGGARDQGCDVDAGDFLRDVVLR